jgi:protein-arginine kinase activator protein McsA
VGSVPPACPDCGQSWEAFARTGRYGCPGCASRFEPALRRLLDAPLESATESPRPGNPVPARAREALAAPEEAELSLALLLEDYELAARIRDRAGG